MPKGTSSAEVTSDSKKIRPVALAVELRLSEGRQAGQGRAGQGRAGKAAENSAK